MPPSSGSRPVPVFELFANANALAKAGRIEEAIDIYKAILELTPANYVVRHNIALCRKAQGKLDEAIRELEEAVGLAAQKTFVAAASRHPTLRQGTLHGYVVRTIASGVALGPTIADKGIYHRHGTDWWFHPACQHAFQYFLPDESYDEGYHDADFHPQRDAARRAVVQMMAAYRSVFGRDPTSVLELGTGNGAFTLAFHERRFDYMAVEGCRSGCQVLEESGIPPERIVHADLRRLQPLGRRFDLVVCTDVAEHIEPFFASKLVENCTAHADAVWFFAATPSLRSYWYHVNEQPHEAWDNLFAFLGYATFLEPGPEGTRLYLSDAAAERALAHNPGAAWG